MKRKQNNCVVAALVLILAIAPVVEAEIRYNLIDLDPSGSGWSFAHSINNNGQIVGEIQPMGGGGS
jgi:hypothetical protein